MGAVLVQQNIKESNEEAVLVQQNNIGALGRQCWYRRVL